MTMVQVFQHDCGKGRAALPEIRAAIKTVKATSDTAVSREQSGAKVPKKPADTHGIHDISRVELDNANGLPRFKMPLESGLFLGAKS